MSIQSHKGDSRRRQLEVVR